MSGLPSIQAQHAVLAARSPSRWAAARAWPIVQAIVLFGVFTALLAFVQFGTSGLADNDGYYHIKIGSLMRQQGLTPAFVWLPMSILRPKAFYDHHLLYHVYLSFFTGDGQEQTLILGAKIASILMPALAFLAIWWMLRAQRVRWAALWALGLLAVSEAFLYRMSMPRAQSASLLALALGLHWLLQRRYWLLVPLGFGYVWMYNAFPLLIALATLYTIAALLTEGRFEWRALAYPAIGIGLGLIINPYFPNNLTFILNHLAPKIGQPATSVGNEWYPYETWTLVENSGCALAVWLLGVLALGWNQRRVDRPTLAAFLLTVAFGFLLFKSRRFVEYFPAFAVIFAALSLSPLIDNLVAGRPRWRRWAPLFIAAALAGPLAITLAQARAAMATSKPGETYADASRWLREHTPAESLIFQTDWDDFPRLFFYNSSNIYTIGLDPTYMERYDPRLYAEWVKITRGEVERPGAVIRSRFGAAYVLSDLKHRAFLRQAKSDPRLREVYRDSDAVIFAVVD